MEAYSCINPLKKAQKEENVNTQSEMQKLSPCIKVSYIYKYMYMYIGDYLPRWYKKGCNTYLTENISGEDIEVELLSMLFS